MEFPSLSHHGGTRGVTGSCHQLHLAPSASLLIDCGLEQGAEAAQGATTASLGFDVQGIEAIIITHVHLDHVGRIPALLAAGYRGPIAVQRAFRPAAAAGVGRCLQAEHQQ